MDRSDSELLEEIKNRLDAREKAIHDLTAATRNLETVNKKLLESERLKSNFISNIRNEMNNPLSTALVLSKIISSASDGAINGDTLASIGETLYREVFNLNFQLQNIFGVAEIEAGEFSLSISNVNVLSILESTIASFSHRASEKRLRVILSSTSDLKLDPFFKTDSEKLKLLIANLLANAIEYSHPEGIVEMNVLKNGGLNLFVKDSGIGIAESEHKTIFDRFRQLDTGSTKSHAGHGLGLSITRAIVELLNGSITVDSKPGSGAAFSVHLPDSLGDAASDVFSNEGNEFFFEEEGLGVTLAR